MNLLDSNILIYSAAEENKQLRKLFTDDSPAISIISKLEVLGYHSITPKQVAYFKSVFELIYIIPITDAIIEQAILYRQKFSMSVGDAIIASTARLNDCDLYTNNTDDFKRIKDFRVISPVKTFLNKK